jgi:hypothetical protein
MRRTQKNREIMTRLVQREVKRQLGVLGMATRDEVARLHQRVRALEQELERAGKAAPAKSSAAKTSAAKTSSTKTSARARSGGTSSRSTASSPGTGRAKGKSSKSAKDDGQS